MDNPFQSPAILSLCTGMRGLERGIERAIGPVRAVAYVEIEAFIVWNLVKQIEQGLLAPAPVWTNLKTFPSYQFHKRIHGITGGYPCQPFSVAGKQKGEEDPRHLWPYIREMVRTIEPVWCFFENVPGHLNLGYEQVKAELEELPYTIKEGIYSAEEVGATHRRERLFILALANSYRNGSGIKPGSDYGESQEAKSEEQRKKWNEIQREWLRTITGYSSTGMADASSPGLQKPGEQSAWEECQTIKRSGCIVPELAHADIRGQQQRDDAGMGWIRQQDAFPARPGQEQYSWESPRTIESGLGTTINGYNFREDLLRMAGNGVVEQTAEIAFIDLLRKHGILAPLP